MADVMAVTDETFEAEVLKSDAPVMVDFYATWCGPCKRLSPLVKEVAREYAGKLKAVAIDIDGSQKTAGQFGIMAVPTLVFFKGGQEAGRLTGLVPKQKIADQVGTLVGG
jgi:thioredoxin 1